MAKEWAQIDSLTARLFESEYAPRIYQETQRTLMNGVILALVIGLLGAAVSSYVFTPTFSFIFRWIEMNFLAGEALSLSQKRLLSAVILFIFIFIVSLMIFLWNWLQQKVKDEFLFDRSKRIVSHIKQSRLAYLLGWPSCVRTYHLSDFSKVSISVTKTRVGPFNFGYCFVLKLVNQHLPLQIGRSAGFSSLESLARFAYGELLNFQDLARKLGDFLKIRVEEESLIDLTKRLKQTLAAQNQVDFGEIENKVNEIYKVLQAAYGQIYQYRPVNSEAFRYSVDLRYYHRLQSALVEQGYCWVGDVECVTLAPMLQEQHMRTFLRCMINPTHNTSIAIYHLNPGGFLGFLFQEKVFDCETELTSGQYLVTTNASKPPFDYPPSFDALHLPPGTSYKVVLRAHFHRLQRAITAGLSPTPLHTLGDVLAMQERLQQAKNQYRQQIGYITPKELWRFFPSTLIDSDTFTQVERCLREKMARS
ncbi:MAG: hypothetical protein RMI89_11080 [Gloeomargarita sp. SKYBB_i_bin120]|nr:hypothetical protein [Gloeomargarita sp. SKYG98]MCS7293494.1 hypothetical protein [Gloeomargarita sp. SKYB120]MDW8179060.1 hypothetical protein [Gloeomargarita sp. SKYBB_i_bin120]